MRKFKSAKLQEEQIKDLKGLEKKLGDDVYVIAIEKPSPPQFLLEAKISPKTWEMIDKVYPDMDVPSSYPSKDEAFAVKSKLKVLLSGKWAKKYKKCPIRVREV
ncbi:MAG: hypothetical protein MI802_23220 [Desulfobacterales bacterium]|nr:hypothetical protein [Desulfobacterales bacterium]